MRGCTATAELSSPQDFSRHSQLQVMVEEITLFLLGIIDRNWAALWQQFIAKSGLFPAIETASSWLYKFFLHHFAVLFSSILLVLVNNWIKLAQKNVLWLLEAWKSEFWLPFFKRWTAFWQEPDHCTKASKRTHLWCRENYWTVTGCSQVGTLQAQPGKPDLQCSQFSTS